MPALQVGGQVITFLHGHLGMRIASPAVLEQIGTRFRQAVARFAEINDIPMVKFKKGTREIDVMRPLRHCCVVPSLESVGWIPMLCCQMVTARL